jgi:hypothetical protein
MKPNHRRHALKLSLGFALTAVGLLFLFQNCQKAAQLVVVPGSNSTAGAGSVLPANSLSYLPLGVEQVCAETNLDKKSIINVYLRVLHRCADRAGLDFWYGVFLRSGNTSGLTTALQATSEYQNQKVAGKTPSDLFCLGGDSFQVSAAGQVLTSAQLDAIQATDSRVFSSSCATSSAQNVTASVARQVKETVGVSADAAGGYVCYVAGDSLRNHIVDLYIIYLDRCPEASGLQWWVQNWVNDQGFIGNPDVVGYLSCRYPNGNTSLPPQNSIDFCYVQKFANTLCPNNAVFVRARYCRKTGS